MDQKSSKADELFFVVDGNNQPLDPLPRKLVHGHGVWHRVTHVWIRNSKGQLLCQQRSFSKELNPGYWESFFGGHLGPGETDITAAMRETGEELGITLKPDQFHLWKVHKFHDPNNGYNNEFMAVHVVNWDGDIADLSFKDQEVEQIVWKSLSEISKALKTDGGKGWSNCGYEPELLEALEKGDL